MASGIRATYAADVKCPKCDHVEKAKVGIATTAVDSMHGMGVMMDAEVLNGPELTDNFDAHYKAVGHARAR